jgi:hypothetical protein
MVHQLIEVARTKCRRVLLQRAFDHTLVYSIAGHCCNGISACCWHHKISAAELCTAAVFNVCRRLAAPSVLRLLKVTGITAIKNMWWQAFGSLINSTSCRVIMIQQPAAAAAAVLLHHVPWMLLQVTVLGWSD